MPALVDTTYTDDDGTTIYRMKLSQNDFNAQPTTPADTPNNQMYAKVTRHRKAFGIKPRTISLSRTVGTAPDTAEKYKTLAVCSLADWKTLKNSTQVITIGGTQWNIITGEGESIR